MSHVCRCSYEKMGLRLAGVFHVQNGDMLGYQRTALGSRGKCGLIYFLQFIKVIKSFFYISSNK